MEKKVYLICSTNIDYLQTFNVLNVVWIEDKFL